MKRRLDSLLNFCLMFEEEDDESLKLVEVLPTVKRRKIHEMFESRDTEGIYPNLVKKYLMSKEDKFVQYFRVSPQIFHLILENICDEIDSIPVHS